jgi:deoxycytidylate deaminase
MIWKLHHQHICWIELSTVANNSSVYRDCDSDNHAEINAIGEAAKTGKATNGCTIFITMPPCKRCFGAIIAAGIRRIISTRTVLEPIATIAKDQNVELVVMDANRSNARIAKYFPKPSPDQLEQTRAQRDQERRDRQLIARDRKRKAQEGLQNNT